jgi:TolA-binding protein
MKEKEAGLGTPIPNELGRFRRDVENLVRSARSLGLIAMFLGLALWLLPYGRVFAWDDTARMDSIASKAEQASDATRSNQSEIQDLQTKINGLADKIDSKERRLEALERKAYHQEALERRIKALEDARDNLKARG